MKIYVQISLSTPSFNLDNIEKHYDRITIKIQKFLKSLNQIYSFSSKELLVYFKHAGWQLKIKSFYGNINTQKFYSELSS